MTLQELFQSIADAIREKTGETGKLKPTDFPEKIQEITTSGVTQEYVDSILKGDVESVVNTTANILGRHALHDCLSLKDVQMSKAGNVAAYALSGALQLYNAWFPKAKGIGAYAFENCVSLLYARVPLAESVSQYAFKGCTALPEILFERNVTVGSYAFQGCTALEKVELKQYGTFSANAFNGCKNLKAVILRNVNYNPAPKPNVFTETPIADGGGYLYVSRSDYAWIRYESDWTENYDIRIIEDWPDITGG